MNKKKIGNFALALSLLAGGSVFVFNFLQKEEEVLISEIGVDFIADFTDKKNLVGASDYVFKGKVLSKEEQINLHVPATQFSVEILKEVKGDFEQDEIVITQYGGYTEDEDGNKVLVVYEHDQLLESGKTYMFTANKQADESILIIPTFGHDEIKDKGMESGLEKEYVEAYKNQKVPELAQKAKEDIK